MTPATKTAYYLWLHQNNTTDAQTPYEQKIQQESFLGGYIEGAKSAPAATPAPGAAGEAAAAAEAGEAAKTDWLAVIEAKRNDASGGPYAGQWGPYWQQDLEDAGPAIGIMSTTLCAERVTPEMAEKGIDGDEWAEHELVALLAYHEDGEELPRFEENIDYICELHNRFPLIASELRQLRAEMRRIKASPAAPAAPEAGPVGGEPEGDGGEWALRRLYDYTSEAGHYEARAHIIAATEALGFFISDVD